MLKVRVQKNNGEYEDRDIGEQELETYKKVWGDKFTVANADGTYGAPQAAAPQGPSVEDRRKAALEAAQAASRAGIEEGKKMGEEIFGNEALGRLDASRGGEVSDLVRKRQEMAASAGTRSGDITDVIARRKAALEGYSPAEMQAMREQQQGAMNQQQQLAMRQMKAQAASQGIRGGAQAAQQLALQKGMQRNMAQGERELALQNIGQKEKALGAFEQSATGAEGNEFQRSQLAQTGLENMVNNARAEELKKQTFNIGQQTQEKFGMLASQLGMAGMSAQEAAAAAQQILGEDYQKASAEQAAKSGGKK